MTLPRSFPLFIQLGFVQDFQRLFQQCLAILLRQLQTDAPSAFRLHRLQNARGEGQPTLLANTNMTWFNSDAAYSLWGAANNTTSSNVRSSEKYQAGGRTRYNLTDRNYLFGQASWLSDRFNGYDSRSTLTGGYGRQLLNGPLSDLRVEFGPGVRHDEYHGGGRSTKGLAYGAANYSYQLTDNTKFIQGVSALANEETTLNSESALNVAINDRFSLRVAYTVTYNSKPPASAPKNTDTTTSVTLVYGL